MLEKRKILLFLSLTILSFVNSLAQQPNSWLEYFSNQKLNFKLNQSEQNIHTSFKPILIPDSDYLTKEDSLYYSDERDKIFSSKFKSKWIYRKIRTEDFINHRSEKFRLKINPLFNFELKNTTQLVIVEYKI